MPPTRNRLGKITCRVSVDDCLPPVAESPMSQATPEQEAWGGGEHYQFGSERGAGVGQLVPNDSFASVVAFMQSRESSCAECLDSSSPDIR